MPGKRAPVKYPGLFTLPGIKKAGDYSKTALQSPAGNCIFLRPVCYCLFSNGMAGVNETVSCVPAKGGGVLPG